MQTLLKVLGAIVLIWVAIIVLGWVFKALLWALFWVLVIGVATFLGFAAYTALKSKPDRNAVDQ